MAASKLTRVRSDGFSKIMAEHASLQARFVLAPHMGLLEPGCLVEQLGDLARRNVE